MAEDTAKKERILILEDVSNFRVDLAKKLRRHNFDVDEACTSGEAETRKLNNTYEVAIIDINLEESDKIAGLLVAQDLIQKDKYVKVIIVTAHSRVPLAVRAMKIGAYSFISKADGDDTPGAIKIFWHDLFQEVELALEKRRLECLEKQIKGEMAVVFVGLDKTQNDLQEMQRDLKKMEDKMIELNKAVERYKNKNMLIDDDEKEKYRRMIPDGPSLRGNRMDSE